jgi:hypothetical protein
MFGNNWRKWFSRPIASVLGGRRRDHRPGDRRASPDQSFRPALESLEDRTLLAVSVLSPAAVLSDTAAGNVQGPASVSQDGSPTSATATTSSVT